MLYFIDSANQQYINEALKLGVSGVTANTSMYRKEGITMDCFIKTYANTGLSFLSMEVIGTFEEMLAQAMRYHEIDNQVVIKINFSKEGLQLVHTLHKLGYKTALTLVFSISQALAGINAGVDYIFFFIGRNEEMGCDACNKIYALKSMIEQKEYKTKIVAASIKHLYHLEELAIHHIDYAAIPYDLYMKSLIHTLTDSGASTFEKDYQHILSHH